MLKLIKQNGGSINGSLNKQITMSMTGAYEVNLFGLSDV